ncbi:hypothetical protein WICPIJ_007018 [Wickerhamomyces pijperi]|uniref:Dolichyl-phosphate-mannose--protein mannosyltransferase n=1 Tax=Wickerhamomyces pijperi TaxID=599730 RepID=A0A9P8TKV3_WICPI|nr:hypothetical protein WICPIJ_007018 [Wickerhamomyces pijperi]
MSKAKISTGRSSTAPEDQQLKSRASVSTDDLISESEAEGDTDAQLESDDLQKKDSSTTTTTTTKSPSSLCQIIAFLTLIEPYVSTVFYTFLSYYIRSYKIDLAKKVIWDESHFGKFGSYYLRHEFYHDVHPPLGKMIVGLTEYLSGWDGEDFAFESGKAYPETLDFVTIRMLNALFSLAVVPVAYWAANTLRLRLVSVHLVTMMVCLESTYIALGKFILLDSTLLFFTATTFLTFVKIHDLNQTGKEFTTAWYVWYALTGISIGCVCSVKWVGLFVTSLVGLYTVHELLEKLFLKSKGFTWRRYSQHWAVRIVTLIFIPVAIYLICFKIHFALLYKSGTGDSSTSTLFQVNLEGNKILNGPRNVQYGSELTIRSQGQSPNLLHSHTQIYPEGSNQQQITAYGHSDGNNNWIVKYSRSNYTNLEDLESHPFVKDGDMIRLSHKFTNANLHSHDIQGHVSKQFYEVSGYGNEEVGDVKDDWVVEIVEQVKSGNKTYPKEDPSLIHPISTSFRLRHVDLGCYLATTGKAYPAWGFKQSEVICKPSSNSWLSRRDKSTWWNVEDHINEKLESDDNYIPPSSSFFSDFILINFAMASSNSALVPDEDKFDVLSSKWWEWPSLYRGLRMCGWSNFDIKYFLIGNLFNTWGSSFAVVVFCAYTVYLAYSYQRQTLNWSYDQYWKFLICGIYPLFGWILHFLPFIIMGRVTYVHHYVPALFFAMYVMVYVIELFAFKLKVWFRVPIYVVAFAVLFWTFWKYRMFHVGMSQPAEYYKDLALLKTWRVFGN